MKTFFVTSIGCRTNQYETEAISQQLVTIGLRPICAGEIADVCIINTCAVTVGAESSSKNAIRSIVAKHPGAFVVVTGCMVEHQKKELLAIDGISLLVANVEKEKICQILFPEIAPPFFSVKKFSDKTRAFVKIQDGCNHHCTYCIIPQLRGRSISRSIDEIYDEVVQLTENGHKEIVLTGVNLGDFQDGSLGLPDLLYRLEDIPGLHRLRLSSINPNEISSRLVETIGTLKKTCPSLHLVLQSGSSSVLRRMERPYDASLYENLVEQFRSYRSDFTVTTDCIVGFPGESEEDFLQTCALINRVKMYKVHIFPYSKRPKTKAFYFPDHIPSAITKKRVLYLTEQVKSATKDFLNPFLGGVFEILTEKGAISGQTVHGISVICDEPMESNQLIHVRVVDMREQALIATRIF